MKAPLPLLLWMALMFFGCRRAADVGRGTTPAHFDPVAALVEPRHFSCRHRAGAFPCPQGGPSYPSTRSSPCCLSRAWRGWVERFWRRVALTLASGNDFCCGRRVPSVVRRFAHRIARRCPPRLQRRASRYDDLRDDLETEFDVGMNRDFQSRPKNVSRRHRNYRNSALQLFQIEPCEEARGVVAVNGVKLPALFGNGFTSVDLEPG